MVLTVKSIFITQQQLTIRFHINKAHTTFIAPHLPSVETINKPLSTPADTTISNPHTKYSAPIKLPSTVGKRVLYNPSKDSENNPLTPVPKEGNRSANGAVLLAAIIVVTGE